MMARSCGSSRSVSMTARGTASAGRSARPGPGRRSRARRGQQRSDVRVDGTTSARPSRRRPEPTRAALLPAAAHVELARCGTWCAADEHECGRIVATSGRWDRHGRSLPTAISWATVSSSPSSTRPRRPASPATRCHVGGAVRPAGVQEHGHVGAGRLARDPGPVQIERARPHRHRVAHRRRPPGRGRLDPQAVASQSVGPTVRPAARVPAAANRSLSGARPGAARDADR